MDIYESVKKEADSSSNNQSKAPQKTKKKRRTAEEMAAATDKRIAELEALLARKKEEKKRRAAAKAKTDQKKRTHRLIQLGLILVERIGGEQYLYDTDDSILARLVPPKTDPREAAKELIRDVDGATTVDDMLILYKAFCFICKRRRIDAHSELLKMAERWDSDQ